jgi:kynureninase
MINAYHADEASGFDAIKYPQSLTSLSAVTNVYFFESGLEILLDFNFTDLRKKEKLIKLFIKAMSRTLNQYAAMVLQYEYKVSVPFVELNKRRRSQMSLFRYLCCLIQGAGD